MVVNGFLFLLPCLTAIVQSLIVNIASAAEGSGKLSRLLISREKSVFESLLNYHRGILTNLSRLCNHYQSWALRPRCQLHLHPSLRLWMEYSLADLDNRLSQYRAPAPVRRRALF